MQEIASVSVAISYAQLCIFDPSLDQPFNNWTPAHAAQGFAWRPGSVSFRLGDDIRKVLVTVLQSGVAPALQGTVTGIRVPFTVSPKGEIEIASITDGFQTRVQPGDSDLYFLMNESGVLLVFTPRQFDGPAVLIASPLATPQDTFVMDADPA